MVLLKLDFDPDRTDAGFRLRLHYLRLLYAFERVDFLKLEDDVNLEFEHQFTKIKTSIPQSYFLFIGSFSFSLRNYKLKKNKSKYQINFFFER